jgi:hypothetical protein
MLYAYKAYLDNKIATVVTSGDTIEEYENWLKDISIRDTNLLWENIHISGFFEMLSRTNPFYGFKRPVYAFYHSDETQQNQFISEEKLLASHESYGRDRHHEMINNKKIELGEDTGLFSTSNQNKTIAEISDLVDGEDPYDNRSEEEIEKDKKLKEKLDQLQKEGKLSSPSFGPNKKTATQPTTNVGNIPTQTAKTARSSKLDAYKNIIDDMLTLNSKISATAVYSDLKTNHGFTGGLTIVKDYIRAKKQKAKAQPVIEEIRVTQNADGSYDIDNVLAHKRGGEIDTDAKNRAVDEHETKIKEAKAGKRIFSPQDFAAVLRGDGRDDNYGIPSEKVTSEDVDPRTGTRRIKLSDEAEQARKEYQEQQKTLEGKQKTKNKIEDRLEENKEKHEAENDVFRGADLVGEEIAFDSLDSDLQNILAKSGYNDRTVLLKDYPYNATLAGKILLPYDCFDTSSTVSLVETHNLTILGSITVAGPGVYICEKDNADKPGWAIWEYREESDSIWVVKIR